MSLTNKLYLNKTSLASILASAFEVYPRETYGLLFGRIRKIKKNKKSKEYFVKAAYPFQTAERKYTSAGIKERIEKESKRIFMKLNLNFLGDYHSHTKYNRDFNPNLKLSGDDFSFVKYNSPLISLILVIKPSNKRKINKDLEIYERELKKLFGYYKFREKFRKKKIYRFEIGAYVWDKETHKPELIEISLVDL